MPSVCLNMIVKDEGKIIRRCLLSLREFIDYWVIVDTGSSDNTKEIICDVLRGIPGEIHERDWVDFAANRNMALELAINKSDYILFIDADDTLEFDESFDKEALDQDAYYLLCRDPVIDSFRLLMIKNREGWEWKGVVHEELTPPPGPLKIQLLKGVMKNGLSRDGHASINEKERYLNDARLLENSLLNDPENTRSIFYLAQSYVSAGELELALKYYDKRSQMGGYADEVFWSLYYSACIKDDLKMEAQEVIDSYWKAYLFLPRAEPLCYLARHLLKIGQYAYAYLVAKEAVSIPIPRTLHFVRREVYDYETLLYYAVAQHLIDRFEAAEKSYEQLLLKNSVPDHVRKMAKSFQVLCRKKERINVVTDRPSSLQDPDSEDGLRR